MSVPYLGPSRRNRGATTPGALHEGKPWRAVCHIDTQTGTQGGECWVLRLECGHTAFRPMRKARPDLMLFARPGFGVRTAPHRVRCLHCEPETP